VNIRSTGFALPGPAWRTHDACTLKSDGCIALCGFLFCLSFTNGGLGDTRWHFYPNETQQHHAFLQDHLCRIPRSTRLLYKPPALRNSHVPMPRPETTNAPPAQETPSLFATTQPPISQVNSFISRTWPPPPWNSSSSDVCEPVVRRLGEGGCVVIGSCNGSWKLPETALMVEAGLTGGYVPARV
jgi:hypothetical protein